MWTDMDHPRYPLQDEQTAEYERMLKENRPMSEIKAMDFAFNARRDAEHPGWKQKYDQAWEEWRNGK